MKILFNKLVELLKQVPEIRWIDLDTSQLQLEQPPLTYPAALLEIAYTSCQDIAGTLQLVDVQFNIKMVFATVAETNAAVADTVRQKSLAYLDIIERVHGVLQNYTDIHFENFSRVSLRNIPARAGLKVYELTYITSFENDTAN